MVYPSQKLCDFSFPEERVSFPETFTSQLFTNVVDMTLDDQTTSSVTVTPYALTVTNPPDLANYNDVYDSMLPYTPQELVFITGCLTDISLSVGDPQLNIDLSACVLYNGAPLNPTVLATSAITLKNRVDNSDPTT